MDAQRARPPWWFATIALVGLALVPRTICFEQLSPPPKLGELVEVAAPPPPLSYWRVRPICESHVFIDVMGFARDVAAEVPCLQLPPSTHEHRTALRSRMRGSGCVLDGPESFLAARDRVAPDWSEREQIERRGLFVFGIVEVCATAQGRVISAELVRSTGYAHYDAKLVAAGRDWQVDPRAAGCGLLGFEYDP